MMRPSPNLPSHLDLFVSSFGGRAVFLILYWVEDSREIIPLAFYKSLFITGSYLRPLHCSYTPPSWAVLNFHNTESLCVVFSTSELISCMRILVCTLGELCSAPQSRSSNTLCLAFRSALLSFEQLNVMTVFFSCRKPTYVDEWLHFLCFRQVSAVFFVRFSLFLHSTLTHP